MLDSFSTDKLFVEIYEKQIFSSDFHPIREYVFRLSFLTTLNIYKDYFKSRQRLRECEAKFCSYKLWLETEFALVHLSLEEAAMFVRRWVLWSRSFLIFIVWMNCKNYAANIFLKLVIKSRTGIHAIG